MEKQLNQTINESLQLFVIPEDVETEFFIHCYPFHLNELLNFLQKIEENYSHFSMFKLGFLYFNPLLPLIHKTDET